MRGETGGEASNSWGCKEQRTHLAQSVGRSLPSNLEPMPGEVLTQCGKDLLRTDGAPGYPPLQSFYAGKSLVGRGSQAREPEDSRLTLKAEGLGRKRHNNGIP